jgi:GTPase
MVDEDKTAVLIMREDPRHEPDSYMMEELRGLAAAAGYRVLAEIIQRRSRDHRFQLGKGKIAEAMGYSPDKLIFYNPLSPLQVFSIRSEFSALAIDRLNLILEIFASRAMTREAKLQVELARLSYEAPHIRNAVALNKLSERPGYKGSGAYEESAYHDLRGRIAKIRSSLKDVEIMGEDRRQHRRELGFDLVALAGYTNAGKSTLLNALTDSVVEVKDQPFTTLSPTTRAINMDGRRALLTDTVGFIDDLPHFLIKSFKSTLSEISQADLVLLVADVSDPPELLRRKMVASHKALWDCKSSAPIITVLNKADCMSPEEFKVRADLIADLAPNPIPVSAKSGLGLEELRELIHCKLQPLKEFKIKLPYTLEGLSELSRLYEAADLVSVSYDDGVVVELRARDEAVGRALKLDLDSASSDEIEKDAGVEL